MERFSGSQARGLIGATAAGLHHSHRNVGLDGNSLSFLDAISCKKKKKKVPPFPGELYLYFNLFNSVCTGLGPF